MNSPRSLEPPAPERGIFVNRTLNMRSVEVVGYDMDYTLIHYNEDAWETAAFEAARDVLSGRGWPVADLHFDPAEFTIGLVFDLKLGNVVKATRFGYVVRAQHGTSAMTFEEMRSTYADDIVELSDGRFVFMNTLFELSRASLFCQLVEIHDSAPLAGVQTYGDLYDGIDEALGEAHMAGLLKAKIIADPDRFVALDPDLVPTLLDQRAAGKKLALITNSEWAYTSKMMTYAFDQFCPSASSWRDCFDLIIVSANKPRFFSATEPIYRIVDEDQSLLVPHTGPLVSGDIYFGGNARLVEEAFGASGRRPLYVGDHLFGDVHVTKDVLHWRTALITRELEAEIAAAAEFADDQALLAGLMQDKIEIDRQQAQLRTAALTDPSKETKNELAKITDRALKIDKKIAPLAKRSSEMGNVHWGPLMRAGNDKSLFARQVERYADVYTSRVSNFGYETPFGYLRAARGSLPHDQ